MRFETHPRKVTLFFFPPLPSTIWPINGGRRRTVNSFSLALFVQFCIFQTRMWNILILMPGFRFVKYFNYIDNHHHAMKGILKHFFVGEPMYGTSNAGPSCWLFQETTGWLPNYLERRRVSGNFWLLFIRSTCSNRLFKLTHLFEQLADGDLNPKKRVATQLVRLEKKILHSCLQVTIDFINQLPDHTVSPCPAPYAPLLR